MRRGNSHVQFLPSRTDILVSIFLPNNALIGSRPRKLRTRFHQSFSLPERGRVSTIRRIFWLDWSKDQVWLVAILGQLAWAIGHEQIGFRQIVKRHASVKIDRGIGTDAEAVNLLIGLLSIPNEYNSLALSNKIISKPYPGSKIAVAMRPTLGLS